MGVTVVYCGTDRDEARASYHQNDVLLTAAKSGKLKVETIPDGGAEFDKDVASTMCIKDGSK